MRTIEEIHADIERANEDRHELWHLLSEAYDPEVVELPGGARAASRSPRSDEAGRHWRAGLITRSADSVGISISCDECCRRDEHADPGGDPCHKQPMLLGGIGDI